MNISVTLRADEDLMSAINKLAAAIGALPTGNPVANTPDPVANTPTKRVKAAAAEQPAQSAQQEEVSAPPPSATVHAINAVTTEQVRAALNGKVKEKKSKQALDLLRTYGVTSVVELNPTQLQDIFPKVQAL